MKKVIIHIGSGKTGTSAIQTALSSFQQDINLFTYPILEGVGHQNIEVLFREEGELNRGIVSSFKSGRRSYNSYFEWYKSNLDAMLSGSNNIVISSEFFFRFKPEEVEKVKSYFEDHGFNQFLVCAYIRAPDSYYLSFIQQQLKASHEFSDPELFHCNYKRAIMRWARVFGKDNIKVTEFSRGALFGGDAVDDFSKIISEFFEREIRLNRVKSNSSLSAAGMVFLKKYREKYNANASNIFKPDSNELLRIIQSVDYFEKPVLSGWAANKVLVNNAEDVDYLFNEFGLFSQVDSMLLAVDESSSSSSLKTLESVLGNYNEQDYVDLNLAVINKLLEQKIKIK
jgi:hypothetical protein